jgi:hypothetical protein
MSVIGDLRELLQDMVTPDLKALRVTVDNIENKVDGLEKRLSDSIAELRGEARAHRDATRNDIRAGVAEITEKIRIDNRLTALEEDRDKKRPPERRS